MSFKYLVVQGLVFFLSVLGLFFYYKALVVAFLVKLALPPFHLWFFNISSMLSGNSLFFFMSPHKLLPLFFLSKIVNFTAGGLLFVFLALVSSFVLLTLSGILFVLVVSSMNHSSWLVLIGLLSGGLMLLYWLVYSAILLTLVKMLTLKPKMTDLAQPAGAACCWLVLSGIPPFSLFWLKLSALVVLGSLWLNFILLISSILSLTVYFRAFHLGVGLSKSHSSPFVLLTLSCLSLLVVF